MKQIDQIRKKVKSIFSPEGVLNSWARKKTARSITAILRTYLIICLCFVVLYPLFYMVSIAFRNVNEVLDPAIVWIPKTWTLDNMLLTMEKIEFPEAFKNTTINSLVTTIFQIITCSLAGYGFARFDFKGKKILFAGVLLSIIVPMQTVAIPMFMQLRFFNFFYLQDLLVLLVKGVNSVINLINNIILSSGATSVIKRFAVSDHVSLYNSQWALLLPAMLGNGIRGGLYIYIFRQFFRGMPIELEDAANIDGCGFVSTFTRIIIPLSRPPMLVVFILSVIWYWNDVFMTSLFYNKAQTLAMQLDGMAARFALEYDIYQVQVFQQAGSILTIAPVLLMYLFLQRYFMRSIDQTGLK